MIGKIDSICAVLGSETLSQTTIPALTELATNPNWRIRVSSMELLFYLVKQTGIELANDKIIKLMTDYISDKANSVRKEGMKLLVKIQD